MRVRMKTVNITYHIGLPKAASSYLQRHLLPALDLCYLGKHYTPHKPNRLHQEFRRELTRTVNLPPYLITAGHRQRLTDLMQAIRDDAALSVNSYLYSNEGLFGNYNEGFRNIFQSAHALHAASPGARIILILRRQDTFIESLYRQSIRNGNPHGIQRFMNGATSDFGGYKSASSPNFDVQVLCWSHTVRFYRDLFGMNNVLALPNEMLAREPQTFIDRITSFLGLPAFSRISTERTNSRDTLVPLTFQRYCNLTMPHKVAQYIGGAVRPRLNWIPFDRDYLDKQLKQRLQNFFREDNRALGELLNCDLEPYGYY